MNNKRAIVNLATDNHKNGQYRLSFTLAGNTDADVLLFNREHQVGAPLHNENPYAFKVYAMDKAFQMGYTSVLWLDASMHAIKNIDCIFDLIEQDGYFFQDSGWPNSRWTNESAEKYFGTKDGVMFSSGVTGINFKDAHGRAFFASWKASMLAGMFRGSWDDHRHDQTCGSIIAHKMGLKLLPGNSYFQYAKPTDKPLTDTVCLFAEGIN